MCPSRMLSSKTRTSKWRSQKPSSIISRTASRSIRSPISWSHSSRDSSRINSTISRTEEEMRIWVSLTSSRNLSIFSMLQESLSRVRSRDSEDSSSDQPRVNLTCTCKSTRMMMSQTRKRDLSTSSFSGMELTSEKEFKKSVIHSLVKDSSSQTSERLLNKCQRLRTQSMMLEMCSRRPSSP